MASNTKHFLILDKKNKPVRCVTGKKAEKSKKEIEHMPGYSMREMTKDQCPYCNPVTPQAAGEEETVIDYTKPAEEERKPGRCQECDVNVQGQFKLRIVNGHLIRKCKACGSEFDIDTMTKFEGAI